MPSDDGFDLGPSWFWPRRQPALATLADELGLTHVAQSSDGDVIFERMSREPAGRYAPAGPEHQDPGSRRFVGGSAALVRALAQTLPPGSVHLSSTVTRLELEDSGVRLAHRDGRGSEQWVRAEHVALAVPPRLLEATVELTPAVSPETAALWCSTPTWMAAQAKFFALYESPFWQAAGLSGTAQSMVGPMLEIHDATTASGQAALFGFLGVSPVERRSLGESALAEACVAQLVRIFGPEAKAPTATLLQDWAADPLTSTADDPVSSGHPDHTGPWVHGPWADRLVLAASETSPHEAGYLAGAIEASTLAATRLRRHLEV